MARPKVIQDDEIKDVHVWIGKTLWEKLSKLAHDEGSGSSISALMRRAAEEKYGKES